MALYPSADQSQQHEQQTAAANTSLSNPRMATQQPQLPQHLSHSQQDLLLAALNSQAAGNSQTAYPPDGDSGLIKRSTSDPSQPTMSGLYMSPQNAELENFEGDYTPDLDYLDGDGYDFDNADLGGEMIGALPGGEGHEKRSRDERDDSEDVDPKRQETHEGEKGAKKPGRKPLTSEPTTKRKAQNRAAQRAFRERKERHLKDLETKVNELTKSSEADKHENGLLKAHVGRLQVELKEFRKRLSLNNSSGGGVRNSPPLAAYTGQNRSNSGPTQGNSNFQFDFPKFGGLPGSQIFGTQQTVPDASNNGVVHRGSVTPPVTTQSPTAIGGLAKKVPAPPSRESSAGGYTVSPKSSTPQINGSGNISPSQYANLMPSVGYSSVNNMHGFASTLPQMGGGNPFGDLFSPSLLKSASVDGNNFFPDTQQAINKSQPSLDATNGGDSTAGLNRVFQFNSGSSASDSASPSASSLSQWNANANSSCDTSPEPSHGSPGNGTNRHADSFSEKVTPHGSVSDASILANPQASGNFNIGLTGNNLDYNVQPAATSFDPVLFGDYRENQDNIFGGNGDFSNGFFDEALNPGPYDFGSPSNLFGILQPSPQQANATLNGNNGQGSAAPSKNLMAEMEKTRDGGDDDYGLPSTQPKQTESKSKLISCNNIWNQLQSNPDFQNGAFDLDNLCSELRAKARCSESGVMVEQGQVDAALRKLGGKDESGKFVPTTAPLEFPHLMFEQETWDNVFQRLGGKSGQF